MADLENWPALPYAEWRDSCLTLHLWTQIVGKIRVACAPWVNHSWHVTLYVTASGLSTSFIPFGRSGLQIDFDFIEHRLHVRTSNGGRRSLELRPRSVADFYRELMQTMSALGIDVRIHGSPNELPDPIPFARDEVHGDYDPEYAYRFWRATLSAARVLDEFRSRFIGKCSPVHFFWGSFDLAVTRFSGRPAPPHPGGVPYLPDWVAREAYSHELHSAGFWPGGASYPDPIFYAYAYPAPNDFASAGVEPAAAAWHDALREFVLPYDAVRASASPEGELMAFLESTYRAAAELGGWPRDALEWRDGGQPPTGGWRLVDQTG